MEDVHGDSMFVFAEDVADLPLAATPLCEWQFDAGK